MNIYKLELSNGANRYLVANSFADAEKLWNKDFDRLSIVVITIIEQDIISEK